MSIDKQKEIFSRNLLHYIETNQLTQKEVADAIKVSPQTFNTWVQGIALPRMGKIQALADYFGIRKSDLIDEQTADEYYYDPKANEIAEMLRTNPNYRVLFDAARDSSPEDLLMAAELLNRFKQTNPDG